MSDDDKQASPPNGTQAPARERKHTFLAVVIGAAIVIGVVVTMCHGPSPASFHQGDPVADAEKAMVGKTYEFKREWGGGQTYRFNISRNSDGKLECRMSRREGGGFIFVASGPVVMRVDPFEIAGEKHSDIVLKLGCFDFGRLSLSGAELDRAFADWREWQSSSEEQDRRSKMFPNCPTFPDDVGYWNINDYLKDCTAPDEYWKANAVMDLGEYDVIYLWQSDRDISSSDSQIHYPARSLPSQ
jgi:hypothetical protein